MYDNKHLFHKMLNINALLDFFIYFFLYWLFTVLSSHISQLMGLPKANLLYLVVNNVCISALHLGFHGSVD